MMVSEHTNQELLIAFQVADPVAYDQLWLQLGMTALFGAEDEPLACYLSPAKSQQRLQTTVVVVLDYLRLVNQHPPSPPLQQWVDRLQKILAIPVRMTSTSSKRRGR